MTDFYRFPAILSQAKPCFLTVALWLVAEFPAKNVEIFALFSDIVYLRADILFNLQPIHSKA